MQGMSNPTKPAAACENYQAEHAWRLCAQVCDADSGSPETLDCKTRRLLSGQPQHQALLRAAIAVWASMQSAMSQLLEC